MAKGRTGSREFFPGPMTATHKALLKRNVPSGLEGRHPPLHILFVHSHVADVERWPARTQEGAFHGRAEIVVTPRSLPNG